MMSSHQEGLIKKLFFFFSKSWTWLKLVMVKFLFLLDVKQICNIYFWLRNSLANWINSYLRLKIRVVCGGIFSLKWRINSICHTISESELCLYTRKLKDERLKPVFRWKIIISTCVVCVVSCNDYLFIEKLCFNARI